MTINRRALLGAGVTGITSVELRGVLDLAPPGSGPQAPAGAVPAARASRPGTLAAAGPQLGKDATAATRAVNATVLKELDVANAKQMAGIDTVANATRGFVASRSDLVIKAADGHEVWNLASYDFLGAEQAPPTVNPSLWRHARLNMNNGLFRVYPIPPEGDAGKDVPRAVQGIYQVRGFDLANMTIVEGTSGIIVIDPLMSVEVARAALDLYAETRGARRVVAVIYTHSHADLWGGVKGIVTEEDITSGKVPLLAPVGFLDAAVSENVTAGPAMIRRSDYMYAPLLPRGEKGQVDDGLGKNRSDGATSLIAPTDLIRQTGDARTIDGMEMVFQLTPDTEAPSEMTIFFPKHRVFDSADLACDMMHNILTPRGAPVRDANLWAYYLNEAVALFGDRTDVVISQHNWPMWGQEQVVAFLKAQRDLFKYTHDQTLRLMNHGYTGPEIAEMLEPPAALRDQWFLRGYYGTMRHNVKAVYQQYLGWYDANPANLDPLPPVDAATKYVAFMGGAPAVIARARVDFDKGDYRWVAEVMNKVVFAEPDNMEARDLAADALEQLGYQAESGIWRNVYLMGAYELRNGVLHRNLAANAAADVIAALTVPQLFDYLGINLIADRAEGKHIVLNWTFTDLKEKYVLNLENAALTFMPSPPVIQPADADASLTLARTTLDALLSGKMTIPGAIMSGVVRVEGNLLKVADLFGMMDTFDESFNIVTP